MATNRSGSKRKAKGFPHGEDSDAQRYRYLTILSQQPGPVPIKVLQGILGCSRWMVAVTLRRMYDMMWVTRVHEPFADVRQNRNLVGRHLYSITDTGRRWMKHYEMMEERYGSEGSVE